MKIGWPFYVLLAIAGYVATVDKPIEIPDWIDNIIHIVDGGGGGGGNVMTGITGPHVVIFHESKAKNNGMPEWFDANVEGGGRKWLETNAKDTYLLLDKDTKLVDKDGKPIQPSWVMQARASFDAKAQGKIPWIVYGNGKKGGSCELPAEGPAGIKLLDSVK